MNDTANDSFSMQIYLGVRETSTIPRDVPLDKWLYDPAWMYEYRSVMGGVKRNAGRLISYIPVKPKYLSFIVVSALLFSGAVYLQKQVNSNPYANEPQRLNTSVTKPIKGIKPEPHETATSAANAMETLPTTASNKSPVEHADVTVVRDHMEIQSGRQLDPVRVVPDARAEPPRAPLATNLERKAQKPVKIDLPLPELPRVEQKPILLAPLPSEMQRSPTAAKSNVVEPRPVAKQKTLMAIEDSSEEPKSASVQPQSLPKTESTPDKKEAAQVKPVTKEIAESNPVVLHAYKILTLTKNSVVIVDQNTNAQKQIFVGAKLPGGETVRSVNEDAGTVTTDVRTLKMK